MSRTLFLLTILTVLFIGALSLDLRAQRAEAVETAVTINEDGSVFPKTASIDQDGNTYTFTDNIDGWIEIKKDNIIIDGKGYTLQGSGSKDGFYMFGRNNVTIRNTKILNFHTGIWLSTSHNNSVSGNTVAANDFGILMSASNGTLFYHNNFLDNSHHVIMDTSCCNSTNFWDNGVEGNYWDNYTGFDSNADGIGESAHEIVPWNTDHHPLIGMAYILNTSGPDMNVISNSTIEDFQYSQPDARIVIHVSNMTPHQSHGFCRLTIPHTLLSPPYNITINNSPVAHSTLFENATVSTVYFSYHHSSIEIVIIPEFSPLLVLPFFIIATLLTAIAFRKKWDAH